MNSVTRFVGRRHQVEGVCVCRHWMDVVVVFQVLTAIYVVIVVVVNVVILVVCC